MFRSDSLAKCSEIVIWQFAARLTAQRGLLELGDLRQFTIAQDQHQCGQLELRGRQQLKPGHQECAIAGERNYGPVRTGERGSQVRRHRVAHA